MSPEEEPSVLTLGRRLYAKWQRDGFDTAGDTGAEGSRLRLRHRAGTALPSDGR